jgi:hypothetical protein
VRIGISKMDKEREEKETRDAMHVPSHIVVVVILCDESCCLDADQPSDKAFLLPSPLEISRQRRASPTTSASPSSLPSSLSLSICLSEMSWTICMTSSAELMVLTRRVSLLSRSCSRVQIAICWKVGSPDARKRDR